MATLAPDAAAHISIDIAPDAMQACVQVRLEKHQRPPGEEEIIRSLETFEILVDEEVKSRVVEYLALLGGEEPIDEPFIVAQGKPAFDGKDEDLVWDAAYQDQDTDCQGDSSVNYYAMNSITTVEKDAVIGTISPIESPHDGVNIKGEVINHSGSPQRLQLDESIRRAPDNPTQIIANFAGRVVQEEYVLKMYDVLQITGDVGFETGNVDATSHVHITGAIPDRFEVKSPKSISVGVAIEAATVIAKGDVVVQGGIVGRNSGRVRAGRDIVAKFCSEANIAADRDIKISSQMMSSTACAGGRLLAESASVIGGCVCAKEGVKVAVLGSDANIPTRIVVGVRTDRLIEAAEITEQVQSARGKIEQIRQKLQALADESQQLSADQKRHVADLTSHVEQAEAKIDEDEQRPQQLLEDIFTPEMPKVCVSNVIHGGVTVRMGDRETVFREELKGPLSIERRKINNVTELVAVNSLTASAKVLTSQRLGTEGLLEGLDLDRSGSDDSNA